MSMDDKIDKIVDDITVIKVSQARTEIIMDEHIKRTALAEENMTILRKQMDPIKKQFLLMNFSFKAAGVLGGFVVLLERMGWWDKLLNLLK